jgi:hypothetical protein
MKLAYVHLLPLELYPPATTTIELLSQRAEVRVYSTSNARKLACYESAQVQLIRYPLSQSPSRLVRLLFTLSWHLRTAFAIWRWRPDAVFYVEPHSALAAFVYLFVLRGRAKLLIHHHEYYAPEDYARPAMGMPRLGSWLEHRWLYALACWISQTNQDRLRFVRSQNPGIGSAKWRVLPNYPRRGWSDDCPMATAPRSADSIRLVYVGSASFRDTFVREIVEWAQLRPQSVQLDLYGHNIADDVAAWIESLGATNVRCQANGVEHGQLPAILSRYDVGLVLYKGNTVNFVYNLPNKLFEYLLCGLEVWYPIEMLGIRPDQFGEEMPLRQVDFRRCAASIDLDLPIRRAPGGCREVFTAEAALAPLFSLLDMPQPTQGLTDRDASP